MASFARVDRPGAVLTGRVLPVWRLVAYEGRSSKPLAAPHGRYHAK